MPTLFVSTYKLLFLFQCLVKFVEENRRCPHNGCRVGVDPGCHNMVYFREVLDTFVDYNNNDIVRLSCMSLVYMFCSL